VGHELDRRPLRRADDVRPDDAAGGEQDDQDEVDEDRVVGGEVEGRFDAGGRDDLCEADHGGWRPPPAAGGKRSPTGVGDGSNRRYLRPGWGGVKKRRRAAGSHREKSMMYALDNPRQFAL